MLLGGDEIGRTQQGNNNAYCQDNEMSWFDWEHVDRGLLEFTRRLIHLQATAPGFPPARMVQGRAVRGAGVGDIAWFRPDGKEMVGRRLAAGAHEVVRGVPQRRRTARARRRRPAGARRQLSAAFQRAPRAARVYAARRLVRTPMGRRHRHGRRARVEAEIDSGGEIGGGARPDDRRVVACLLSA